MGVEYQLAHRILVYNDKQEPLPPFQHNDIQQLQQALLQLSKRIRRIQSFHSKKNIFQSDIYILIPFLHSPLFLQSFPQRK